MKKAVQAAFALLLILVVGATCALADVKLTPLEDSSEYTFFEYWVEGPNVSLLIPIGAQHEQVYDEADWKAVYIETPALEDCYIVFFAILNKSANGVKVDELSGKALTDFVSIVSNHPENLPVEILEGGIYEGQAALRVQEKMDGDGPDGYAEHLVAVHGDWVLNMMLQRKDKKTGFPPEAVALQEELLRGVFEQAESRPRLTSFALPDGPTLSLPGARFVMDWDEPDTKSFMVMNPKTNLAAMQVYAQRDKRFAGQTVATMDEALRNDLMERNTVADYEPDKAVFEQDFASGSPALFYDEGNGFEYAMALVDDWALIVLKFPFEQDGDTWPAQAQRELLRTAMGEEAAMLPAKCTWADGVLTIPLLTKTLQVRIPEGYDVDVVEDEGAKRRIVLFNQDTGSYYMISTFNIEGYEVATQEEQLSLLQETQPNYVKIMENRTDAKVKSSLVNEGLLGLPTIHVTSENQSAELYVLIYYPAIVDIFFFASNGTIQPEESESLLNLLIAP